MRETKNNTCRLCKEHIDKSDVGESWMTIIISRRIDAAGNEKGWVEVPGQRFTLCCNCYSDIYMKVIDKELEKLEGVDNNENLKMEMS